MPRKPKLTTKEMLLLIEGILIAFLLQLFYDTLREDPFYQSIMPIPYWRSLLAIICGALTIVMLRYVVKQGKTQKEGNDVVEEKTEDNKEVRTSEGVKETKRISLVLRISKWKSLIAYSIIVVSIDILLVAFSDIFFPRDLVESRVVEIARIQAALCGILIPFIGFVAFFYVGKMLDAKKDVVSKCFEYSVKFAEFAKSQKKIEDWHKEEIDRYYKEYPSTISEATNSAIIYVIYSCVFAIASFLISLILVQFSLSNDASYLWSSLLFIANGIAYFVYSWFGYEETLRGLRGMITILGEAMTAVELELVFYPEGH